MSLSSDEPHSTYARAQACKPRCEPCKRAAREYMRAWRQQQRQGSAESYPGLTPYQRSGLGWPNPGGDFCEVTPGEGGHLKPPARVT